jgi:hypothetical protein
MAAAVSLLRSCVMKSGVLTSIMGWVALLVIGSGVLFGISAQGPGGTEQDRAAAGLILFVGVAMGISWILSRKRIRAMEYQARMLRTRLYRIQK